MIKGAREPETSLVKVKRVYQPACKEDGWRILVDRLWPRGVSKSKARIDLWFKEIAPSGALRKWFAHDPKKWTEFQKKYRKELSGTRERLRQIKQLEREHGTVTLLYSAKDERHNQAVALGHVLRGATRA